MTASVVDFREFKYHCDWLGKDYYGYMILPIDSISAYLVVENDEQLADAQDLAFCEVIYEKVK
jgi:hypothetical protein